MEGIVQVFCGSGRGKTSAALGTAFKCLHDGGTAYVMLFDENEEEVKLFHKFEPEFKVFSFDKDNAIQYSKKVITTRECDVLIMDEMLGIINEPGGEDAVLEIMNLQKESGIRMIITGSDITDRIRDAADSITEFIRSK